MLKNPHRLSSFSQEKLLFEECRIPNKAFTYIFELVRHRRNLEQRLLRDINQ